MTERKVFTVTDLGPGDGGKGTVVHKLCTFKKAHTVLKTGGAQGSHGVSTSSGQSFAFSQFGCGTLDGVCTHITKNFVMEPLGLMKEGRTLIEKCGIYNVFDLITIDENALCITPFHAIASELRELARKDKPKGTVGLGGGETVVDSQIHPGLAIYAKDLSSADLRERLMAIREQKIIDLSGIIASVADLLPADKEHAERKIAVLNDIRFVDRIVDAFQQVSKHIAIVDENYLKKNILARDGVVVVESSHGILTDKYYGFHPHTTQLRTLPHSTLTMLADCGYDGSIVKLGVTRAYQIRHGAGPMVTASDDLTNILLPGSHKDDNRWQGKVRTGALDFVALRYAIEVCGGPQFFDGIAVSWMDQIQTAGAWHVCDSYANAHDTELFSHDGTRILVQRGEDKQQLLRQNKLGDVLDLCIPNVTHFDVPKSMDINDVTQLCAETILERLQVPVRMISYGPTEIQKVLV